MSRILTLILLLFVPLAAEAGLYLGGQYGLSSLSHKGLKEYDVIPKGSSYSGFLGLNHEFVGVEGFYTTFSNEAKLKHEGSEYVFTDETSAFGGALRFSTKLFNIRAGLAQFTINHTSDAEASISDEIDQVYVLNSKLKKMGSMVGVGMHLRMSDSTRFLVDFTHYSINGIGYYQTASVGIAILFKGDFNLFNLAKDGM